MNSKKNVGRKEGSRYAPQGRGKGSVASGKGRKSPTVTRGRARPEAKTAAKRPIKRAPKRSLGFDLIPFIMLGIALLAETCFITAEQSGAVGMLIHKLFFGLFGVASYLVPVGAILIAFFWGDLRARGTLRLKLILYPVACVMLATAATLFAQNGLDGAVFSLESFWVSGTLGESGGVFGGVVGFVLSGIFGGTAATVIALAVSLAVVTFALGKSRLGIWMLFARSKRFTAPVQASVAPAAPKSAPRASAVSVDTVLSPVPEMSEREAPFIEDGQTDIPEVLDAPDGDGVTLDGTLTDTDDNSPVTVSTPDEGTMRQNYRPADLMEDFGFKGAQEKTEEKYQIYSDTPVTSGTNAYSPFGLGAVSGRASEREKGRTADKPRSVGSGRAYSPFSDPVRSMADRVRPENTSSGAPAKPIYEEAPRSRRNAYSPFSDPVRSMAERPVRTPEPAPEEAYEEAPTAATSPDPVFIPPAPSDDEDRCSPPEPEAPIYTVPTAEEKFLSNIPITEPSAEVALEETAPTAPVSAPSYTPAAAPTYTPAAAPSYTPAAAPSNTAPISEPMKTPVINEIRITEPAPAPSYTPAPEPTPAPLARPVTPIMTTGSDFDGKIEMPEPDDGSGALEDTDERDPRIINPFGRYDHLRYPDYQKPPTSLLDLADASKRISEEEINDVIRKILDKFEAFHVDAQVTGYSAGPSITRYEVTPAPGTKVKQIMGMADDIELALQSENVSGEVRMVTVPGKSVIGIEVPNSVVSTVSLRSLIENPDFQKAKSKITVCVGVTVSGKPVFMNIDDMPHVLVAGQTKSGKSVAINAMIMSIIYRASPDEVQFILVDPKQVELSIYNDIPHMVMPVIDDPKRAAGALQWAVAEMERRYTVIKNARVRDRNEYYKFRDSIPDFEYMPQIIIIIDELADLMLQVREHVEEPINRLAAKARACGINLVIGTQRPSTDIVTGLIKANIPSKIAFRVASNVDSRVILGNVGAEKLLGRGDMLYHPTGGNQIRAQGAFVDTPEIKRVLDFIIDRNGKVEYDPEILYRLQSETDKLTKNDKKAAPGGDEDYAIDSADVDFDYLCQAIELVINLGKATTNVIQRHLKIGFNRASNIVDKLEDLGFISKSNGSSRPRDVLIDLQTYYDWKNSNKK